MKHGVSASLIKGTIILTIFAFLGKALGALFKISLTNLVGTEGMGIYGLVFPIFVFFEILSSDGFNLGLTVNIAKYRNKKDVVDAYKNYALKLIVVAAVFSALTISLLSPIISGLQGGAISVFLYIEVALCVVSVALLSYFKGVVRGYENFKLFSISDVVEDLTKIIFSLCFAYLFRGYGVEASIAGVFGGIIISSILSIMVLLIFGKKYFKRNKALILPIEDRKDYLKFSLLATFSSLVIPAIQFIDSILIVRLLGGIGLSVESSTKLFGLSRGSVSALLNLPAFLLVSFEFLLLPSLSRSGVKESKGKTSFSLILALFVSFPFTLLYLIFPTEILSMLYGGALSASELVVAARLLVIGALAITFSSISSIVIVCLESEKHTFIPFLASLIAGVLKVIFIIIFVPKLSIYGAELSSVLFTLVEAVIVFVYAFRKKIFYRPNLMWLVIVLWVVLMLLTYLFFNMFLNIFSRVWAFVISLSITAIIIVLAACVILFILKKSGKLHKFKNLE